VRIRAEWPPAVGHHFAICGQLGKPPLEVFEGDGAGTVDVPRLELLRGAHVDEHDIPLAQTGDQLLAPDRVDVFTEILPGCSLDLGETGRRDVTEGEPEGQHLVAGQRVPNARSFASARHHTGGVQRLKVLGGVRGRLVARARELVDGPGGLGEKVDQLEPSRAGERLAHQRDRLEQRVFLSA